MYLHGSKLAFKPSFKPTKVNAAVNFLSFKIIYSHQLQTTSNQPLNQASNQNYVSGKALRIYFGLKVGLKVGLKAGLKDN